MGQKRKCIYCSHKRRRCDGFETLTTTGKEVFVCWFCYSRTRSRKKVEDNKMIKRNWQLLTTLSVSVLICIFIAWALLTKQGDNGFIKTSDGTDFNWNKSDLPITCWIEKNTPSKIVLAFEEAIAHYEKRVGIHIFTHCESWVIEQMPVIPGSRTVRLGMRDSNGLPFGSVQTNVGTQSEYGGDTTHYYNLTTGHIDRGVVVLLDDLSTEALRIVALHEVGHVLCLEHDTFPGSIMLPSQDPKMTKTLTGKELYKLLDTDVDRIKLQLQ